MSSAYLVVGKLSRTEYRRLLLAKHEWTIPRMARVSDKQLYRRHLHHRAFLVILRTGLSPDSHVPYRHTVWFRQDWLVAMHGEACLSLPLLVSSHRTHLQQSQVIRECNLVTPCNWAACVILQ